MEGISMEDYERFSQRRREAILSRVAGACASAGRDVAEVDVVAVYGGGSIFLRPALEKPLQAFCDRARIQLVYIEDEEDAVWMEAYGLEAFLKSKLFENLKKQAA